MNTFFFLKIGLHLWGRGPFLANSGEQSLQVSRRKRIGAGEGSEEQQRDCSTGRDGSPSRPSKKSARSESTPYLDGITDTIDVRHFGVVGCAAAAIPRARPLVQPRPPPVK